MTNRTVRNFCAALALVLLLGACASDGSPDATTDDPAYDDALWGEEFAMGASRGGLMVVDDDVFRLGVVAAGSSEAKLEVLHSSDDALNRIETVEQGSRFVVGDYRIRVGTVDSDSVVAMWAKRIDS